MSKSEYLNIISEFDDVKLKLNERAQKVTELRKVLRRIRTLKEKYTFLYEIINLSKGGKELECFVKTYFRNLNCYNKVIWLNSFNKDKSKEDIQLWDGEEIILIDCTGVKKESVPSNHANKLVAFIANFEKQHSHIKDKKIRGLLVVNHNNEIHYSKRNLTPFNDDIAIENCKKNHVSLITTVSLFNAFIKIKNGELNISDFKRKLIENGVIKF